MMARMPLNLKKLGGRVGEYFSEAGKVVFPHAQFPYEIKQGDVLEDPSEEEKLHWLKESFSWGEVSKIHSIGRYQIVETSAGKFYPYFSFEELNRSADSLEVALLVCIGTSTGHQDAAPYAARVLFLN